MIYEIIIGYFTVRFLGELLFYNDVNETDIRCSCTLCSGMYILN